jgi:hypothetical protein
VSADIRNTVTEISPEVCEGGLRAVVRISNVVLFDQTVAAGEEVQKGTAELPGGSAGLVYQGAPVTAKAWCLGEDGQEVGYAETEGSLNIYKSSNSINVFPSYIPDNLSICSEGVRRGKFPCIAATNLIE